MVVPSHFGPLPQRPGSALLISPYINLVSHNPSRISNAEFDFIENGSAYSAALDYIGCTRTSTFVTSWNPLQYFKYPTPVDPIPTDLVKAGGVKDFKVAEEGEGLELFNCPYVNPSVCRDLLWWEEAMPGGGATMITSGAKEILYDDIINWTNVLEEAGVEPISVVKPLGVHDWLIFDSVRFSFLCLHLLLISHTFLRSFQDCSRRNRLDLIVKKITVSRLSRIFLLLVTKRESRSSSSRTRKRRRRKKRASSKS